jgi:hypothetical protein
VIDTISPGLGISRIRCIPSLVRVRVIALRTTHERRRQ